MALKFTDLLDDFILDTYTRDGYHVIFGVICRSSYKSEIITILKNINSLDFGSHRDPYEVDRHFLDMIYRLHANCNIRYVLAGTIIVPDAFGSCGAVIGIPDDSYESADEELNPSLLFSNPETYLVCYPGKMGIAFSASETDADRLSKETAYMINSPVTAETVDYVVSLVKQISDTYIVCTDTQINQVESSFSGRVITSSADKIF